METCRNKIDVKLGTGMLTTRHTTRKGMVPFSAKVCLEAKECKIASAKKKKGSTVAQGAKQIALSRQARSEW